MPIKFIIRLTLITVALALIYFALAFVMPAKWYFPYYIPLLILFFVVTYFFHLGLTRSQQKSSAAFVRFYMGASGVRLLIFLMIILIYAFNDRKNTMTFALTFFSFYIVFTVFEVASAYTQFGKRASNNLSEKNPENNQTPN